MLKKNLLILIIPLIFMSCKSDKEINIDTSLLYGVWAFDIYDPHAVFLISKDKFQFADIDRFGIVDYDLDGNELTIYNKGFIQWGKITSITKDSLKIKWRDTEIETKYVRFPED